jgi:hypothetical protein
MVLVLVRAAEIRTLPLMSSNPTRNFFSSHIQAMLFVLAFFVGMLYFPSLGWNVQFFAMLFKQFILNFISAPSHDTCNSFVQCFNRQCGEVDRLDRPRGTPIWGSDVHLATHCLELFRPKLILHRYPCALHCHYLTKQVTKPRQPLAHFWFPYPLQKILDSCPAIPMLQHHPKKPHFHATWPFRPLSSHLAMLKPASYP